MDSTDDRLITASSDVFATNRHTAEAVNDSEYLPPSADEKTGLINKWPFDAQKKDYTYWDGLLGEAVDATYDGTETIDGLETYKYHVLIEDAPAEVVTDIEGVCSQDKYLYIDPTTGRSSTDPARGPRARGRLPTARPRPRLHRRPVSANAANAKDNGSHWACSPGPAAGRLHRRRDRPAAGLFLLLASRRRQEPAPEA